MIPLYDKLTPLQDLQGPILTAMIPPHCLMSAPKDTSLFPNDLTLMSHAKTEQASLLGSQLAKGHHRGIRKCMCVCVCVRARVCACASSNGREACT